MTKLPIIVQRIVYLFLESTDATKDIQYISIRQAESVLQV